MPILLNSNVQGSNFGTYGRSFISSDSAVSGSTAPVISQEQMDSMSQQIFNRVNGTNAGVSPWEHIGRFSTGTVIDLADSVVGSPLNPFGERGDVWKYTSRDQQEYYERNKDAIQTASAVLGGIGTAVAAEAFIIPRIAGAMASSAAITGSRIWQVAERWNTGSRLAMLAAQREAAQSGITYSMYNNAAGLSFLANRAAAGALGAVRTAPMEYAVMGANEAFNSGDVAREGFWIGAAAVLGGTLGSIGARASVRQFANTAEMRDLRYEPLKMSGVMNDLLSSDPVERSKRIVAAQAQNKESAYTTGYLTAYRSADPSGYAEAGANASRLKSLRDTMRTSAVDSIQKIISTGISGASTVRSTVKNMPEARYIVDSVSREDPFVFHGMAEAGIPRTSIPDLLAERTKHIEALQAEVARLNQANKLVEAQDVARKARVLKQQEGYALVNGSWMAPDSELAKAVAEHKPELAKIEVLVGSNSDTVKINLPVAGPVRLDASLMPINRKGTALQVDRMPIQDRLHLAEAGRALVEKLASPTAKTKFKLTPKAAKSWFSLDLAAEVLDRGGRIEFDPGLKGLDTVDDIRRASARIKAQSLLAEVGQLGRITPELRFKYNLPQQVALEGLEDPAGDYFRTWLHAAAEDSHTTQDLSEALLQYREIAGVDLRPPAGQATPRIDGDMLSFNRTDKGDWLRPIVGFFDPKSQIAKLSQRGASDALQLVRAERTAILASGNAHVSDLVRQLIQMPELDTAMRVKGLDNSQITNAGGGLTQASAEILPKRMAIRDEVTSLSASKLQETTERHARAQYTKLMEDVGMQDIVTRLTTTGSAPDRAALDAYFTFRPGWDVESIKELEPGKFGFVLSDSDTNRYRLGMSDKAPWKETYLPNERLNRPVAVTQLGVEAINAFQKISGTLLDADNVLRTAKGLRKVNPKSYFAPVQDTRGAHVAYVFDPNEKLVPGRTIVARNQADFDAQIKRTLDEFGKGSGYTIATKTHLDSLRDIWDEAQMDWLDPGVSSATLGLGKQAGGLSGATVRQGAFNEALQWAQRKMTAQSQDALKSLMAEPLLVARAQSIAENALRGGGTQQRNVYDVYEKMLTGTSKGFDGTTILDSMLQGVETQIDRILASGAIATPARYITDFSRKLGMHPGDLNGVKTYKQIADRLGPYTPFATAQEYVTSKGISPPPTVKGIATKLNSIAASVYLRYLELPHALMNGLGLMATMPTAVMSGKAPISSFVSVKGNNVGLLDGMKVTSNAMKRMFNRGSSADWKHMLKNGDATQSVIEYHEQLGAIQSQAGFFKWAKKIDKWASIVSETSESWSRQTAHFVGLELADLHGIKGMEARHNFAREVANSMIADYAPINRPELFGSGLGSLVGLFQSYGLNHFSKMFRWMEQGQYKMAGMQAAIQATMFGLPGTYGLGTLFDMRDDMTATGSEPTMADLIYQRLGPVLGGAVMHGGVSELTGLALWTRGDMSPRVPGASGTLPALDIGQKVARGFVDGVSAYVNAMPGEGTNALLEVAGREMPNRVLKAWIQQLNNGKEIDAYGQVMSDTRTMMDTAARLMGLRSRRQQAELEAFYSGKGAMERDAARMDSLRKSFRAAVRNHDGDVEAVNPTQYFNDYVKAGGNPRGFKAWVRNLLRDSNDPRSMQALQKSMGTTRNALEVWRYGAYGAWDVEN